MGTLYDVLDKLKKSDIIILFGCGRFGKFLYKYLLPEISQNNIVVVDNAKKGSMFIDNKKILSIDEAYRSYPNGNFIISVRFFRKEMAEQLEKLGVKKDNIIIELPKEIYELYDNSMSQIRREKQSLDEFSFEVNICKHCNLNCSYCEHFSPLSKPDYMDIEAYRKDIIRLSELLSGKAKKILLLGGEPLLHKDVKLFCSYTREVFSKTEILLVTNGLLLEKMQSDFWKICADKDIKISITKYPINLDYDKLKQISDSNHVKCEFFDSTGFSSDGRMFSHLPLDINGKQDINYNFTHCDDANHCVTLESGRLYTCTVAPNSYIFKNYFNLDMKTVKEDSIDIYSVDSVDEILEFLARPIPFCRFCDIKNRSRDRKWEKSQKDIREWTL